MNDSALHQTGHQLATAFIQSDEDRVGLMAAGLFLRARGDVAPIPQDVTAFRYKAELLLRDAPDPSVPASAAQPDRQSFWTGGDAKMGKARLKAALSLLGLVIVMAILFRMMGSFLFAPGK